MDDVSIIRGTLDSGNSCHLTIKANYKKISHRYYEDEETTCEAMNLTKICQLFKLNLDRLMAPIVTYSLTIGAAFLCSNFPTTTRNNY